MNADDVAALLGVPYTDEQRAAIEAPPDAPLQIVAGAGSGKTTVMAGRVVWLVGGGHVRAEQVLGLTFTNKAAASLAAKVREALARLAQSRPALDDVEPTVSTYHAYAGRLVREHGLRVGVEPDARLLADATRFQLAHRVMRHFREPLPSMRWVPDTVVSKLIALESACSDHLVDPAELQAREAVRAKEIQAQADALEGVPKARTRQRALQACADTARARSELCGLVLAYRAAKRANGMADFGDQISAAVRIALDAPDAVAAERARYQAVLLDEYQDTSVAQSRLLAALFGDGRGVTAVGDPCQAIYGWRGASVANLAEFRHDFRARGERPAQVRSLRTSQRNGGRLLLLANALSKSLRADADVAELQPAPARADLGEVVVARHERYADELEWVAQQTARQIESGTPPAEIAVLLRAWKHAAPLHQALTAAGVPVEVVGLGGLLALSEVADVVATLQVIDDPTANAALLRLLTGPRWMFGAHDLRALGRFAARLTRPDGSKYRPDGGPADNDPLEDPLEEATAGVDPADVVAIGDALDAVARDRTVVGLSAAGHNRAVAFQRELSGLRRGVGDPLPDLVARVIGVLGLDVEVAASPAAVAARRRASLATFVDIAATYVDLDGGADLHGFLGYLRAADEYDRGFDNPLEVSGDAVHILTMHKAKGLEWDVVVLPDLTDDVFPAPARDGRWPTNVGELPYRERQDAAALPPDPDFSSEQWQERFTADCRRHERREEDRLAYVAITRARRLVIASNAVWGPTQSKARRASPYLLALRDHAEAGHGRVEHWVPDPAPRMSNPYLGVAPVRWPAALSEPELRARTVAAQRVAQGSSGGDPVLSTSGVTAADRARFAEYDRELEALLTEAREARTNEIEVPLPTTLSASQVLLLSNDPDALAADLARPLPRRPSASSARGTTFHSWVEKRFALVPLLDDDALTGAVDDQLRDADLAALKAAFLASDWADRPPHAVEVGFAVVLGGRVIRGRIDAVYECGASDPDGARWHIVDWKTGREKPDALQLAIYRAAWARQHGCPESAVKASFLHIRTGQLESPPLRSGRELDRLLGG